MPSQEIKETVNKFRSRAQTEQIQNLKQALQEEVNHRLMLEDRFKSLETQFSLFLANPSMFLKPAPSRPMTQGMNNPRQHELLNQENEDDDTFQTEITKSLIVDEGEGSEMEGNGRDMGKQDLEEEEDNE